MRKILFAIALASVLCACNNTSNDVKKDNNQQDTIAIMNPQDYKSANQEGQQQVYDFIKNAKTYYIATVENDQPRVRPFGTINIFEGKLYIQTGHKKHVAQQIAANAKVEICAFNGKEWIRVATKLVEDPRVEAKKSMLDAYPDLRSMYDENDDNTAVYFMTEADARIASFSAPEIDIKF